MVVCEDDKNPLFTIQNSGKRLTSIDLKNPDGKAAFLKLLETADVFLTNVRLPSLGRLGLDYETLYKAYPGLVYAHFSGFGPKGPDAAKPGFDSTAFWLRSGPMADWQVPGSFPFTPTYAFGDMATSSAFLSGILMAIIVGAGLTCAGNTFQSLFSNPLATPDILGVTSGTCVGAILAIILSCSILETQLIALVFGLASVCFTLKIAGKNDGRSMVYLVLAGAIASSLFNAVGSLLKYTADPQDKLPEITYWLMGSFTSASYQKILIGCPLILAGIAVIYLLRWRLNILSLSDDEARASGINIKQTRMLFILASTLITASAVSMCGQVAGSGC